jgi:hypothetical protein
LKRALRELFQKREQPVFQLAEIQDMFSAVPSYAVAALLSEVVGNRSFRLRVKGVDGYIIYRNGFYVFQPDYLSDIRIPLALRVADVPVKKDMFEAAPIKVKKDVEVASTLQPYWTAIEGWAKAIQENTAEVRDVPDTVKAAIDAHFKGQAVKNEHQGMIMINWFYDHIISSTVYTAEHKTAWTGILARVLLEFVWDESLNAMEQQSLLYNGKTDVRQVAGEQVVRKGTKEVFRYVDPMSGALQYVCDGAKCDESVRLLFEQRNPEDPILKVKVDTNSTAAIYGFMVPKSKERRLVFKTNVKVPPPGKAPEKGSECANITKISYHIQMLKDIAALMEQSGYPRFLLVDEVLEEKTQRRASAAKIPDNRQFENSKRACDLKEIILRWLDIADRGRGGEGRRYFYRPVAALKTGHKGTTVRDQ